jgi:hypothetical protein
MVVPFWAFVRDRLNAIADQTLAIRDQLHAMLHLLNKPPALPDPFVCAFGEGQGPDGDRRTFGTAGRAKENGTVLELQAQVPLKSVRIIIFADLERVSIHGIFCGVDLATVAMGDCPVALIEDWPVGVKVRVQCIRRGA